MELLIVDDFPAIVQSLENGIPWKEIGIDRVHTATSAKVAKLLLTNFPIDIMLCDIEMPEENGLELVKWTREHIEHIEIVLLTAHAEFDYIQEAMHLGCFDYLLQPVKFSQVIDVIEKLKVKIQKATHYQQLVTLSQKSEDQHNYILERLLEENEKQNTRECDKISADYLSINRYIYKDCIIFQAVFDVVHWKKLVFRKNEYEVADMLKNTCLGIIDHEGVRVTVTRCGEDSYWLLLLTDRGTIGHEKWKRCMTGMYEFISRNMDFSIALYYEEEFIEENLLEPYKRIQELKVTNENNRAGIYSFTAQEIRGHGHHQAIKNALNYIEHNMNQNISRTDVARAINMSEEYFSRLFKQETGSTFKEYVLDRKMKEAKRLFDTTDFSVGIIASKVGYSNFSYFSQLFKSYTGVTPQEYRKSQN